MTATMDHEASGDPGWDRLAEVFAEARERPEAERAAFLDEACAGRPGLRAEVESMLAAAGDDGALGIEALLLGDDGPAAADEGRRVGAYRLRSLIGRGGMGEVYLAEREGGEFEQRVAVKLLPPGLPSPDLADRFRAERQILARLAHPLIVPLLDGGVTEDGRPYLVMQHVEGLPITEHCARRDLPAAERLRLLAAVCRAVQHAHGNLVVHRDIKPSNILVTADGEPRLLDFGIAKLLAAEGDGPAEATRAQLVWMTPERAAPEQRRGEPVSTATDVYSLGVLLVELLTGGLPAAGPAGGGSEDDESPLRPRSLRGDLERIALKALDPDPARRYASAGQLGEDLERYLAGQPVLAQPDRWAYRARKFVRRHLAATLAAAVASSALLAFAVTSTLQARRIADERDRATAEEARARQVVDLLVSLFEETNPELGPGGDTVALGDFLTRARGQVALLAGQPERQARLEQVLGEIYRARSQFDEARQLFAHARDLQIAVAGEDDPVAFDLGIRLAAALLFTSEPEAAEELLRDQLARQRLVLPAGDRRISETLQMLSFAVRSEEGERFALEALEMERRRRPPDPMLLAGALSHAGVGRMRAGDFAAAAELHRESGEIYRREFGDDHPETLQALSNLALCLSDLDEQEALYRRLCDSSRRVFGDDSAPVANRLITLGMNLSRQGEFAEAEAVLAEAVAIWRKIGGDDHRRAVAAEIELARVLDLAGRTGEALAAAGHAVEAARARGEDPALLASGLARHARILLRSGRSGEALADAREAAEAPGGAGSIWAATEVQLAYGLALLAGGSAAEALHELETALETALRHASEDDPRAGEIRCAQGRALAALGRRDDAATALRSGLGSIEDWPLAHPADLAACREALAAAGG